MPAVFDQYYVKRLHGTNVKTGKNKADLAEQVREDIRAFKKTVDRVVMIWCGSTEIFLEPQPVHQSLAAFEKGLQYSDINIAPSMIYAYAALQEGVPFANGAPNLTVDLPVCWNCPRRMPLPSAARTSKPARRSQDRPFPHVQGENAGRQRLVLDKYPGNRDGEVLDDPESFKTRKNPSWVVLDFILQPDLYPELYWHLPQGKD